MHLPGKLFIFADDAQLQELAGEGCYVANMKKNIIYKEFSSKNYVNPDSLVTDTDKKTLFEKGEIRHEAGRLELWSDKSRKSVVLLNNNFELD